MKLWQSLGEKQNNQKQKEKRRQKTKTWVCLERLTKGRSNSRKGINLKNQRWVWSGNPGGTSATVTVWSQEGAPDLTEPHRWDQRDQCAKGNTRNKTFLLGWGRGQVRVHSELPPNPPPHPPLPRRTGAVQPSRG